MSFLASIQEKKVKLNNCKTKVTKLSGEKYEEILDSSGHFIETILDERHAGYIVDEKPDLQVAEILPYLFLGSQDVVNNLSLLKSKGITHVLSLGIRPVEKDPDIIYNFVDVLDVPEENILYILAQTNKIIKDAKCNNGKIFVHCNAGCSRAPSVVIGYLMATFHYSYNEAYQLVGDKRYIRPNDGFIKQLKQYELSQYK